MAKYQIQDLGDEGGLDILDEDGDLIKSGRTVGEVIEFLEEADVENDTILVLQGALDRAVDEEVGVSDLLIELQ